VIRLLAPRKHFAAHLAAEAIIERDANRRYVLRLRTVQLELEGMRSFSSNSCRVVSDAAIVTMALSIDPSLEFAGNNHERPGAVASSVLPATAPPKTKEAAPMAMKSTPTKSPVSLQPGARAPIASTSVPSTDYFVRSALGWRWGALPRSTGEIGLAAGVERGWATVEVELALSPKIAAYSQLSPEAGGAFAMQSAEFAFCGAPFATRVRLSPCVGTAWTHLWAKGIGVIPQLTGDLSWWSVSAGLQASYRQSKHVGFLFGAMGYRAMRRPQAYLVDPNYPLVTDTIFQPGLWAYRLLAGVAIQF